MAKTGPRFSSKRPTSGPRRKGPKLHPSLLKNISSSRKKPFKRNKDAEPDIHNLYEYEPSKDRRANVGLALDRDELEGAAGGLSDGDGSDNEMNNILQRLVKNIQSDAGVVEDEYDEDIDSDAAIEGQSDEEDYLNPTFDQISPKKKGTAKSSKRLLKRREVTLDEDGGDVDVAEDEDGENEDEDRIGTIPLSKMLDNGEEEEEDELEERPEAAPLPRVLDDANREGSEEGLSDDDVDEDSEDGSMEDEDRLLDEDAESSEAAVSKLDAFIDGLSDKKRKADFDPSKRARRRILPERTERGGEGHSSQPEKDPTDKIDLSDLLDGPSHNTSLGKSAKLLQSQNINAYVAPLHKRQQNRVDRQAAYEATKTRAEHLSFPLQKPPAARRTVANINSTFTPSNGMESAVDKLLRDAELLESKESKDAPAKKVTMKEVVAWRSRLRHDRETMFRAEAKLKRMAKIKSKIYRKIQRRRKEGEALTLEEMEALNPEVAEAERMRMELERAKERATLRHRNTGKWAKRLASRGVDLDQSERHQLLEQLDKGEKLRKRILGKKGSDDDSDDDGDDEEDIDAIREKAFDELKTLEDDQKAADADGSSKQGLMGMKFMQKAEEEVRSAMRTQIDDFREEMLRLGVGVDESGELSHHQEQDALAMEKVGGNAGRMIFRPMAPSTPDEDGPSNETGATGLVNGASIMDPPPSRPDTWVSSVSYSEPVPNVQNPWLASLEPSSSKITRKRNEVVLSKDSSAEVKSIAATKKHKTKMADARAQAEEDAIVEISLDASDMIRSEAPPKSSVGEGEKDEAQPEASSTNSMAKVDSAFQDDGEEDEERPSRGKAFEQRDLVAMAFAGDNVVEQFKEVKQSVIEEDAPKQVDTSLPGWGAWAGAGMKLKAPHPRFIKTIPGVNPESRKDAGKDFVIISEKRDFKARKYQIKELPFPYTGDGQLKQLLDTPLGREWNTQTFVKKATRPRIYTKPGEVIEPLKKM
ncbi:Utp14 protein-domain-containing protein [Cantharellus anzutake]|uniref:Utp14 protein-domain-containing protein n=1 Tax=Cantharellus anzutake TaxID=1750568 RepID=UPI00190711ED|nr:Utp14 protein-domain-containing protein [Cantharellus anzutake]KAF8338136.1 Utp14 protein-domain-containing protein [Cantharellus anzutake]